ncbi:Protein DETOXIFICATION 47 [Mactra antiquata]
MTSSRFSDGPYNKQGEIKCKFCPFTSNGIDTNDDNCLEQHVRHSPLCVHLCSRLGMKRILQRLRQAKVSNDAIQAYGNYETDLRPYIDKMSRRHDGQTLKSYCTMCGVKFNGPYNEKMADKRLRVQSLSNMSRCFNLQEPIHTWADAGFFWNDSLNAPSLQCYYCNVTFDDWWMFRDPLKAHRMRERKCFHNILIYGDDFTLIGKQDSCGDYFTQTGKRKAEEPLNEPNNASYMDSSGERRRRRRSDGPYRTSPGRRRADNQVISQRPSGTSDGRMPAVAGIECYNCRCIFEECVINLCCKAPMCYTCAREEDECPGCA